MMVHLPWFRLDEGVNGSVNALARSGGELYVGGSFLRAGDEITRHIARWSVGDRRWLQSTAPAARTPIQTMLLRDNQLYAAGAFTLSPPGDFTTTSRVATLTQDGWELVDGDIRGNVYTMVSSPEEIIIGGSFISSDELITVNLARWNPATGEWNALTFGSGVASLEDISFVTALVLDGDNLYIGGAFNIADTMPVQNIVCWNRSTGAWRTLGDGFNGPVRSLSLDSEGKLYAGGDFNLSGNTPVNGIARWNGADWEALGEGVDGSVRALTEEAGVLYVGGTFSKAGAEEDVANVARWNIADAQWNRMGLGLNSESQPAVEDLVFSNGGVFAAGRFDVTGADTVRNVARWNPGGWWDRLGNGTDRPAWAIAVNNDNGDIYFGGSFFTAGCKDAQFAALWRDPTLSVDSEFPVATHYLNGSRPNPFASQATVHIAVPYGRAQNVALKLFDPAGREIRSLYNGNLEPGEHSLNLEGQDLPSGLYFLRLTGKDVVEVIPIVKE